MGPGTGGWVYRYSPLPTHPHPHHPGYTPPGTIPKVYMLPAAAVVYRGLNIAVGLKSVAQLTLRTHISGFQGMTEVYNLLYVGRINNHFLIPGNK